MEGGVIWMEIWVSSRSLCSKPENHLRTWPSSLHRIEDSRLRVCINKHFPCIMFNEQIVPGGTCFSMSCRWKTKIQKMSITWPKPDGKWPARARCPALGSLFLVQLMKTEMAYYSTEIRDTRYLIFLFQKYWLRLRTQSPMFSRVAVIGLWRRPI